MDTIKNILKPGGNKDDEVMYGAGSTDPNKGKIAGEGAHFPQHGHADSGVAIDPSANNQHIAPTSGVTGSSATQTAAPTATTDREVEHIAPTSGVTGSSATQTAAPTSTTDREVEHIQPTSGVTGSSATKTAADWPLQDTSSREQRIHNEQTDVADTKPDGSAPHYAHQIQGDLEGPVHNSKILNDLDPRVKEHPGSATTGGHHNAPGHSHNEHHHHSEEKAAAAGAGAGAIGGAAAGSTHPTTSVPTTTSGEGVQYRTLDPQADSTFANQQIGVEPPNNASGVPVFAQQQPAVQASQASHPVAATGSTTTPVTSQTAAPVKEEETQHHGRDAAIGAGAVGAGAVGAHELSKKEAEEKAKEQKQQEKEQEKLEKQHEKEEKKAEKEAEKEAKEHKKELEKEQKQHEKDAEKAHAAALKEQEKERKEAEKEQKKAEKEAEKEQKKAEKEAEKEQKKAEKDAKPGLIDRLLHRNKDESEHDKHKHEAEAAAAGAGVGAAAGHHETTGTDGLPKTPSINQHNKLHKDPPAGYGDAPTKGYASQVTGGTGTTALAQGNEHVPLPSSDAAVPGTRYGSGQDERAGTTFHDDDPSLGVKSMPVSTAGGTVATEVPYQPAPQKGYAAQVTGGTGTTQLAEGQREPITNPRKDDPLHEGPKGYAAQVTGGTGTTELARGSEAVPTQLPTGQLPGGIKSETAYEPAPTSGYAAQVTGGTGTTQLAQGQQDPAIVADERRTSVVEGIKGALVMK